MTTGFHWTYGVVQQQAATGGGGASPPTVGLAATNLGDTNPFSASQGTGAGNSTVNFVPSGQAYGSNGEHTVQVDTTFSVGSGNTVNAALLEVIHVGQTAVLGFNANLEFPANPNAAFNAVLGRAGRDVLAWMGNSDLTQVLFGSAIDVTYAGVTNPNTAIDVEASNSAASAASLTQNVFYFNFQELAQSTAGVFTAGGFHTGFIRSGDQLQFILTVRSSNGLTNTATSTITIT